MSTHSSALRIAANQANATHSTGPKTQAGKTRSSLNAVTTALTGRTVLLSTDDRDLYAKHLESYRQDFQPETERELILVQSIADTDWRLTRIPTLIFALELKGRDEVLEENPHLASDVRNYIVEVESFLKYEKQIRNLQLQESRLHRRRSKDLAELASIQTERKAHRQADLERAAKLYTAAVKEGRTFNPTEFGFDFSSGEIESYLSTIRALRTSTNPISGDILTNSAHP